LPSQSAPSPLFFGEIQFGSWLWWWWRT